RHRERIPDLLESPGSRRDHLRHSRFASGSHGNAHPTRRYEHQQAATGSNKYERVSPHPRRRLTNAARLEQQYRNFHDQSSSDECLVNLSRSKSKSTSSIDTQSVNNILDEYEDLNYRRSSDLSDVEVDLDIGVNNFEELMDMQRRHAVEKQSYRHHRSHNQQRQHFHQPVSPTKISRQTQVHQRSRDRQRFLSPIATVVAGVPTEESLRHADKRNPAMAFQLNQEARSSTRSTKANAPEVLMLRKGEVQKRVDEWLSQTRSQNCAGFNAREARSKTTATTGLTRSNSSAEQKSHRRMRQQESRIRRSQLNGSSSYDDLTHDELRTSNDQRASVAVSTSRGTYRQYLALKNRARVQRQQQQQLQETSTGLRSREASPAGARAQQSRADPANSSFRSVSSNRPGIEESPKKQEHHPHNPSWPGEAAPLISVRGKNARVKHQMENRISSLVKARNEMSAAPPPEPTIVRRSSFKRESIRASSNEQDAPGSTSGPTESGSDLSQEHLVSVNARIQAFQDRSEGRSSKSRNSNNLQGSNVLIEMRNKSPMSPTRMPDSLNQSTFKPQTPVQPEKLSSQPSRPNDVDCLTTKYVEKIYESTLQPEVIHADNLESVFKPGRMHFVYGERTSKDVDASLGFGKRDEDTNDKKKISGPIRKGLEPESKPESTGLHSCIKILQRSPSFRLKRAPPVQKKKETQDPEEDRQPQHVLTTFGTSSLKATDGVNLACDEAARQQGNGDYSRARENLDPNSYESRSTLKLNSGGHVTSDGTVLTEISSSKSLSSENQPIPPVQVESVCSTIQSDRSTTAGGTALINSSDVLIKNLNFEQDLPPVPPLRTCFERRQEPALVVEIAPLRNKPLNYNSVLNDDYTDLQTRVPSQQMENGKIYVTREEMERKRLMDLLRRGEFDAVKTELERSYTLSTPGTESPVFCPPPCSPPPAPAAYISSARASSRRLASGTSLGPAGAATSPERDPLGRLIRYLKTFYREVGTRDPPHLPQWASPLPPGTLCPAHFQPHLQIVHKSEQEHRLENIKMDQIFSPVRLGDCSIADAPRRVSVEGGPGSGRTTFCLRLLYQWATQSEGPTLAFVVPLRELRGGQLLSYLTRELFPRGGPLSEAIQQVWRTLQLLEDRLLFVLDGYDECAPGRAGLGDALDLLEGRLFPEARLLLTCSANDAAALGPFVQRRLHLAGLEWAHVERLCVAYFIHNDMAERACEFLEVLNVQPLHVRQLAQHPLGWTMLCVLYQDSGSLPPEMSALVQSAVKCVVKRSLEPSVAPNEEIPGHCRKRLEDFGKLALAALRENRCYYSEAELRSRGGGLEITRLGFLNRGLTFAQRRKADLYTPIHLSVAEFLSAYYLSSIAQYANILRRELEGLPPGIIGHLAGLLGPKTHLVLNQLCPLEVPARAMFGLLRAAGASDGNVGAVCRLVGAGPGFGPAPSERSPAPLVHTSPLELEGWARVLESSACSLEALEVVFQVERGSDPRHLAEFFEALARNESVKLVRITSLLGQEFPADEVLRLAEHVRNVLCKKRLHEFELVITCLEESAHDRLECVVSALCRGMSQASNQLSRLVLDMNLSGEQVSRVCEALRHCSQVQALHLPHLGCGCEGLASVADLLKERPLLALNLAGSWGAKNEDPSSSGISMGSGSGSGSSGCASSTLGSLPANNRCYSSLPRGALAAYGGSNRPATLPRLPLGVGVPGGNGSLPSTSGNERDRDSSNGSSKRNSDSVLCHRLPGLSPLPACDVVSHQGTGFHEIFNAIREPNCKLRSLNVSKCLLGGLDAACLGETIRRARNLDAVRAAGASRPIDVMPLVLALAEAPCLQLLDLASPRLALDDHPCRLLCHALARNSTLRLLSLEGWTFRIEESETLSVFAELLRCTSVRELSLCNARLHLAVHEGPLSRLGRRDDAGAELLRAAAPPTCPDVVFLRLAGFQVTVNDRLALRGPLLLPFLAGFTSLSELDLSLDKSTVGNNNYSSSGSSLLFIDDRILVQFFSCLASGFRGLQSLRINHWRVSLEESERSLRQIGKQLQRGCTSLSFLKAAGLYVTDSAKKTRIEHCLVQTLLANLHSLAWLCIDGVELAEAQAASIGKCVRERFSGSSLEISAKDVHVRAVKALVTSIEEAGRAEVLYAGGAACRLKITKIQKGSKARRK
ncbi:uncharacterized protein LOC106639778, partial [Copidosoma floridanum]|uniref:uncharacterized protein LOC106639778 n=1 Tax=Copidosoma floridanum TaxID=29053 RepID=UPI000C6FB75A